MSIPKPQRSLNKTHLDIVNAFAKQCRRSILQMTTNAQSGHPGGSLSCIDFLALLYTFIISQSGEKVVISNGHISPAVYAVLAELGYIDKQGLIENFRSHGSIFEGHVTRHVPGVWYGTGPLGIGVSAACGFALSEKMKKTKKRVYALVGDGESQEGQVYEMMHFAAKEKLDNLIVFMDYNKVQLSNSLKKIMPYDPIKTFEAAGWKVIVADGHDYQKMWHALARAHTGNGKPVIIIGNTIMGKGVPFMEKEGKKHKSTWHGKAASEQETKKALSALNITQKDELVLAYLKTLIKWKPQKPAFKKILSKNKVKPGKNREYKADELTDCRSAYGKALLDLAKSNANLVAVTADLADSVKTSFLRDAMPKRHFDVGVAEQHMVSCSGGMSLAGITTFCSTFGVFMTSRAKDQMRVNDINQANVKMVATHCGVSVGKDGPTHQAIDDSGSTLGLLNTLHLEPADPNHCDHLTRYMATHHGNFYMRMGRHKIPVLTRSNGEIFFDASYTYTYGQCDLLRRGKDVTIVTIGATAHEALLAHGILKKQGINAQIVIASSIKRFDNTLINSIKKTKKVITVEDHNTHNGLGSQVARLIAKKGLEVDSFTMLGVDEYQLSGTATELYASVGIDADGIVGVVLGDL